MVGRSGPKYGNEKVSRIFGDIEVPDKGKRRKAVDYLDSLFAL